MNLNWHPETLITANEINWRGRIGVQAAIQKSCDTAISSTLNLPKTTTPEDIKKIYIEAWKQGLKGCTVYVDGSRDPILSTSKSEPKSESKVSLNTITPISRKTIGTTIGATHCKKCACGTLYITTNLDKDGNLVEVFTHTSKGGICQANLNAETRLISLGLRSGIKIEEIEDQLKGIHCPACQMAKAKGQPIDGMSCPDIISRTIKEFTDSGWTICSQYQEEKPIVADSTIETKDKCSECGEPLVRQSGCRSCTNCGFSYCG
jgi:ribonucleoside-diphosphate reductase alpha chain